MTNKEIIESMLNDRYKKKKTKTEDIIKSMQTGTYQPSNVEEYLAPFRKSSRENIAPVKEDDEKKWYQRILKGSEAFDDNLRRFDDGYNFGDITKTVGETIWDTGVTAGSTILDVGTNAVEGFVGLGQELARAGASGIAQISDWAGNDKWAKQIRTNVATLNPFTDPINDFQEVIDPYSVAGHYVDETAKLVGFTLGMAAGGELLGAAGAIPITIGKLSMSVPTLAIGAGIGSAAKEVYSNEDIIDDDKWTDDLQAWTKMLGSGVIEGLSEGLFGIMGVGGSNFADKITNKVLDKIFTSSSKILAKTGISATGELAEEFISYAGNWLLDNGIVDKIGEADFEKEWDWGELGEQMALAFVSGGITSGGSSTIAVNQQTNVAIQEAEKQLGRELTTDEKTSVKNQVAQYMLREGNTDNEQAVLNKVVEDRFNKALQQEENKNLSTTKQTKLKNRITEEVQQDLQKGLIDTDTIESVLGGETYTKFKESDARLTTLQTEIGKLNEKVESEEITLKEMKRLESLKQRLGEIDTGSLQTQLQQEMSQKIGKDSFLQRSYYEKAQRKKPFTYEANEKMSELEKVVYDSASRVMHNSTRSHELADAVAKVSKDTGTKYVFVNNKMLKRHYENIGEGTRINGLVNKKGEVLINVQSPKILEKIIGHETTHLLEGTKEYKAFQDTILEYAMRKGEYNVRKQSLTKMYEGTDANIDAEITSDLVGDYLFTDQEFVNHLSSKQPNVFQKVYNYIKHLAKQFTAGSKEARQLEKVKYRFEQAYRSSQKATQKADTKYSIQGLENYTTDEIKEQSTNYIREKLEANGINDVTIIDSAIHGSRGRGTARTDSDLDIVVEYDGDIREDALFDILNEEPMYIDGVKVDINPINKNKSGTLKEYMERSDAYDKEILAKQDTKYSLTDNQGRELTKEQQEYFKDSKVRDENGNLLTLYHGSNQKFNEFNSSLSWFTPSKEYSKNYGVEQNAIQKALGIEAKKSRYTYEAYLNIKNPKELGNIDGWVDQKWDVDEFLEESNIPREDYEQVLAEYNKNHEYAAFRIYDLTNSEEFKNYLISKGYDGIKANEKGNTSYAAFNSNQIKRVNNKKPTENPDIRYSLSDNQGNELKPNVAKRFENSKVRDENGNLKVVYHGTATGEFTIFDKSKGSVEGDFGSGFYFTDNEVDVETNYEDGGPDFENKISRLAEQIEQEEDITYEEAEEKARQQLYKGSHKFEVYLNIENPAIVGETILLNQDDYLSQYNMDDYDSEEDYYAEIEQLVADDIDSIIWDVENKVDVYSIDGLSDVLYEAYYNSGIEVQELKDRINELYLENENGELVGNEVARQVIESLGYDGIIDPTVSNKWQNMNMGEETTHYIVFKPNQIKSITNENPTDNPDINLSLSNKDYVETSQKGTRGEDVRLQEAIAPIQQTINNLSEQLTRIEERITSREDYAPVNEANLPELEQQYTESFNAIDDNLAPVEQEIDNIEEEPNAPTKGLLETRDYAEVGNRKVKAYQYEHPELRPYFQEAAEGMLYDLENSIKGERNFNDQLYYDTNGEQGFYGTTRHTAEDIAELLDGIDGKYKLSYKDIRQGLEAIIEDHGAENNAASKRIEMYLDKRLREGYTEMSMGTFIPPNQEYLSVLEEIEYNNYYSNLPIDESVIPEKILYDENVTPIAEEVPTFEGVATQRRIDFDNQVLTDKPVSELEKKKAREFKKLGKKEDYISNRADELYDEVKHLRKGVKASYELGRVLDVAFAHIDEHIKGKTEEQAHEIRKAIWRRVTTALKDVSRSPIQTVNENSKVEKEVRKVLNWEYDSKKKDIDNLKDEDLVKKTKRELRKALLIDESDFFINALDNAKNRSMALMNNTDTIRNTELVFGRENGKIINSKIFQPAIDNEAHRTRFLNAEREEIKDLGIEARSKESAAVQKYGEKQYVNDKGEVVEYGDKELASEFSDVATQEKIKNAAKVLRSKYDTYIDEANNVLTKLGFDPIKKRNDYMRHFQELNDVFSRYGIPFNAQNMQEHVLPTDINGLTEFWSPQKNYFASMQARKGLKTTYDAITGIDGYIEGISNLIYHTEDIQRGRAFEELIRDTYGEDKGFENLANLPEALQQARIEKIQDKHLSNYAGWVHEWTNNLAGKKEGLDRIIEYKFGRKGFAVLDTLRKQVGSNLIGLNLSSALTNLIAPVHAMAKTKKLAFVKGTADTVKNIFIKDNFADKNNFLTSRMGADMLSKTAWQKVQDAGYIFMQGMDWFSSNQIVRSKYYELRAKGMNEQQAHAEAGQFAARIMGDRTKGASSSFFNSKLFNTVFQFQLEVNNTLYSMFYDTYHESKEVAQGNAKKMAIGMTFTLGQLFAYTHIFGQTFKAIAGYNPTFDIIGIIATALGLGDDEDEEKTTSERLKNAADMLVDALPYVNIVTGGGRIPLTSNIPNLVGVATGGEDQYGNELKFWDEMKKVPNLLLPTGGGQIKKTTQGLGMFDEDLPVSGSYTKSGGLRFPVEDTVQNRIQAGLFGQYASENARNYFDNERAPLKEKQIQEYADLDMPIQDYWDYREGLSKLDKLEDKFDYIDSLDVTTRQKNIMINNVVDRKESVDMSNYSDFGSLEEFDFASNNKEKYEFLQANNIPYSKYTASEESREAYNWAYNNPEKYTLSKAVTDDVVTYRKYKKDLDKLGNIKDENGKVLVKAQQRKLEYINNLDIDGGARSILYKSIYETYDADNNYIIEYLDSREDISYEDMVTILTELGMKVEGNRIWWD